MLCRSHLDRLSCIPISAIHYADGKLPKIVQSAPSLIPFTYPIHDLSKDGCHRRSHRPRISSLAYLRGKEEKTTLVIYKISSIDCFTRAEFVIRHHRFNECFNTTRDGLQSDLSRTERRNCIRARRRTLSQVLDNVSERLPQRQKQPDSHDCRPRPFAPHRFVRAGSSILWPWLLHGPHLRCRCTHHSPSLRESRAAYSTQDLSQSTIAVGISPRPQWRRNYQPVSSPCSDWQADGHHMHSNQGGRKPVSEQVILPKCGSCES